MLCLGYVHVYGKICIAARGKIDSSRRLDISLASRHLALRRSLLRRPMRMINGREAPRAADTLYQALLHSICLCILRVQLFCFVNKLVENRLERHSLDRSIGRLYSPKCLLLRFFSSSRRSL
jgi:hypothetical protein